MFKIVAEEQGWLDSFNGRYGTDYKQGDVVEEDEVIGVIENTELYLSTEIDVFNHVVAQGEAIWLEKVEKKSGSYDDLTSENVDWGDLNEIKSDKKYVLTALALDVSVPFDNGKDKLINISTKEGRKTVRIVKDYIAYGKRILETEDIDEEK